MTKTKNKSHDLKVTKEIVFSDISDAHAYHKLLFIWINELIRAKVYINFLAIFPYLQKAVVREYILTLGKLFSSNAAEECLLKLMDAAKAVPNEAFDLKLEKNPTAPHEQLRKQREKFFKNVDEYIEKIKKIEKKINPLRNTYIAHNFPMRIMNTTSTFDETIEWIKFAEEIIVCAMDGAAESCPREGDFIFKGIDDMMKRFVFMAKS